MIKAGNWVNVIINVEDGKVVHNRIAKCHTHRNGFVHYFNGDRIVYAIEENVEKLPIKFKGLNPVFKSIGRVEFWCQRRYLKDIGEVYFDISLNNGRVFVIFGALGKSPISGSVSTIDQSKDWLELQYATMIAKARGLV